MPISVKCTECDKSFSVPPVRIRRAVQLFCSIACRAKLRAREMDKRFSMDCMQCGKTFLTKGSPSRIGRTKYCSIQCRFASQTSPVQSCLICGNPTKKYNHKYCSKECRSSYRTGPNNWNWKGGKALVMCNICGKEFAVTRAVLTYGYGKFCSRDCMAIYKGQNATSSAARGRGGKRADLGNSYFRSAWEANYARYLNWLIGLGEIQKWEYEVETFEFTTIKRGSRFYTPDFRVTTKSGSVEYHEVKGWMDKKSQTKLNRMAKHYPDKTIVLVDKDVYTGIAQSVKALIPEWETYGKHKY